MLAGHLRSVVPGDGAPCGAAEAAMLREVGNGSAQPPESVVSGAGGGARLTRLLRAVQRCVAELGPAARDSAAAITRQRSVLEVRCAHLTFHECASRSAHVLCDCYKRDIQDGILCHDFLKTPLKHATQAFVTKLVMPERNGVVDFACRNFACRKAQYAIGR